MPHKSGEAQRQLKDKVDTLDDRRARMKLERYVDDHSERKPDVDIKPPVHIKRYQPTEFKPGSGSEVDGPDSLGKREVCRYSQCTLNESISWVMKGKEEEKYCKYYHSNLS